jgi:hypothetical protein
MGRKDASGRLGYAAVGRMKESGGNVLGHGFYLDASVGRRCVCGRWNEWLSMALEMADVD